MEKPLYDKIVSLLEKNIPVNITITPANKCVEVTLGEELKNTEDHDFLMGEFEVWFYEEGAEIVENSLSNHFDFEFLLEKNALNCHVVFIETNDAWCYSIHDRKLSSILSHIVKVILLRKLKITEELFDDGLLDAEIEYLNSSFNCFKFYYDEKRVDFTEEELSVLKKEVEIIISEWGVWGESDREVKRIFYEISSGYFVVEIPHDYNILINRDEE